MARVGNRKAVEVDGEEFDDPTASIMELNDPRHSNISHRVGVLEADSEFGERPARLFLVAAVAVEDQVEVGMASCLVTDQRVDAPSAGHPEPHPGAVERSEDLHDVAFRHRDHALANPKDMARARQTSER